MEIELKKADPEVADAIHEETQRQENTLVMIASENYASRAVIEAQANVMTNKYAEGYPNRRYYGGCEHVDVVEKLAIERVRTLFGVEHANVQPHSGSQANMVVYLSFLKPGDTILGMDLYHGGHLTHGSPVSFSGMLFKAVSYGVDPERHLIDFQVFAEIARDVGAYLMIDMAHIAGLVAASLHPSPVGFADFITSTTHKTLRGPRGGLILCEEKYGPTIDKGVFPGIQGGPLMHIIAAKAVSFGEALGQGFKDYQRQVVTNARVLAEELMAHGFDLLSGGTDNHLILIDLTSRDITGQELETSLGKAGIAANKNTVPFDKRGPKVTSGLRLGTPSLTTRGMKETEMKVVAGLLKNVLENPDDGKTLQDTRSTVMELCRSFPIYRYLS